MKKIVLIVFVIPLFLSCIQEKSLPVIVIPQNSVLSSYDRYLVIQKSHVRVYESKNISSDVLYILRQGDVVQVENSGGRDEDGFYWYKVHITPSVLHNVSTKQNDTSNPATTNELYGWVLLFSPMRTNSKEKALFLSKEQLQK